MAFSGSGPDPGFGFGSRTDPGSGPGDLDPTDLESPPPARGDALDAPQEESRIRLQRPASNHVDPKALELPAPMRSDARTVKVDAWPEESRISRFLELPESVRSELDTPYLQEYAPGQGQISCRIVTRRTNSLIYYGLRSY